MSGHSKWAQIHRQKGTADAKRGALFTKLGKVISVAARLGGPDPTANFKLRLAVDQAKAANLPKENIERAIKRGLGESGEGKIEAVNYEGFGPNGVALIIECLTDNRNRTSSNIKHVLAKYGGNLGGPNSVSWIFENRGVIRINQINESLELALIDAGAQDIVKNADGVVVYTAPNDLKMIKDFLEQKGIKAEYAEIEQMAKEKKAVDNETKNQLEKLFSELDDDEDVNNYYTNAEI
ncbi:MAG TPA: YebC/PmpR family DNA-binding transcriptional regulator [Patescibacteria group bacterium]|nr:YebC/PmpR family DNA-binding transcriptional regulator [Patescibacteria group bacterium]